MINDRGTKCAQGLLGLNAAITTALDVARVRAERVFVVGGVVRDLLMGREVGEHDLDIVVEGQGILFARELVSRVGGTAREHPPFLTAKLLAPFSMQSAPGDVMLDEVDVATARRETYERPGALPSVVAAAIEEDLWRRDFSANAIALPLDAYHQVVSKALPSLHLHRHVIDPTGGCADITNATLKILHPKSFIDDPTRLFRAIRYLVRLSFHFDMETLAGFVEAVKSGSLGTLSPRRVWNEVVAAFDEQSPSEIVQEYVGRGLFSALPVVSPASPQWVLESLERLEQLRPWLGREMFCEAGKVLVIAGLVREGRDDIARALHEGNKVIQRAASIVEAGRNPGLLRTTVDVAVAYSVHCTRELQAMLQSYVRQ